MQLTSESQNIPPKWCEHIFTEEEKRLLLSGEKVFVSGCITKKRKVRFSCTLSWLNTEGEYQLMPKFDN